MRSLGDGAWRGELRERRECGAFGGADGANRQGGKREREVVLQQLLGNAKGQAVFYARRNTIYNYLVGMVDTTGRPIFQPNAQAGQEGTLIGCPVKVEDAVGANEIYVGYPKNVVGNTIQDIMIESDRDIKKHVITHSGYARYDAKLIQHAGRWT